MPGPDIEAALVTALKADSDLATITDGRIAVELLEGRPAVTVHLAGGTDLFDQADSHTRPVVQVHAYAATTVDASLVARTARAALRRIAGTVHAGVVFGGVEIISDLVSIPDTTFTPPHPHYTFTCAVVARPT